MRTTTIAANLCDTRLISFDHTSVTSTLQVSSDHLSQVADDLSEVVTILDLILDVSKGRAICGLQVAQNPNVHSNMLAQFGYTYLSAVSISPLTMQLRRRL